MKQFIFNWGQITRVLKGGLLIVMAGCVGTAGETAVNPTSAPPTAATEPTSTPLPPSTATPRPDSQTEQIDSYLQTLEAAGFAGTVLVANGDQVLLAKGYGLASMADETPNERETIFDTGSLSKQFTAAAILHLAEQGKLSLDDPLSTFFPTAPADKAAITLHQLLTHSSGLTDYVYGGDFVALGRESAQELALNSRLEHEPGAAYFYSDVGYGLLAAVVEIVSERPFTDYLRTNLFEPAGMTQTGFYNDPHLINQPASHGYFNGQDVGLVTERPGPHWSLLGFGGVLSTVDDLHRWVIALEKAAVLSAESVTMLFTPHIQEFDGKESFYGYGWVVANNPEFGQVVWHDGATDAHNAILLNYREANDTIVIVLSNKIEESAASETFFGIETGFSLAANELNNNFSNLPDFAQ